MKKYSKETVVGIFVVIGLFCIGYMTVKLGNVGFLGENKYTLTFPKGKLPPVKAFWSLTMYDGKTQLLVDNPLGRYLLNSPMLLSSSSSRIVL